MKTVKNMIIKKQGMAKISAKKLAYYILARLGPMEHLKIHKLIYYVEAYHLAYFELSLIEEDFQAWVHGPVVLPVWIEIKSIANVYDAVKLSKVAEKEAIDFINKNLTESQVQVVNDILEEFGSKSAYELECLTHIEDPWIKARKGLPADQHGKTIISKNEIMKYYKTKLHS